MKINNSISINFDSQNIKLLNQSKEDIKLIYPIECSYLGVNYSLDHYLDLYLLILKEEIFNTKHNSEIDSNIQNKVKNECFIDDENFKEIFKLVSFLKTNNRTIDQQSIRDQLKSINMFIKIEEVNNDPDIKENDFKELNHTQKKSKHIKVNEKAKNINNQGYSPGVNITIQRNEKLYIKLQNWREKNPDKSIRYKIQQMKNYEKSHKKRLEDREKLYLLCKKWRENNPEKQKEQRTKYKEKNEEKFKLYRKVYKDINFEKEKEYRKQRKSKDEVKEKMKIQNEKNKEKIRESRRKHYLENKDKIIEQQKMSKDIGFKSGSGIKQKYRQRMNPNTSYFESNKLINKNVKEV